MHGARTAGTLILLAASFTILSCRQRESAQAEDRVPPGASAEQVRPPTIALALSGGGYRASLHGLAALHALESLGLLEDVRIISGVSGGSITAAYYAYLRAQEAGGKSVFSYRSFESKLLYALGTYEIPRTVVSTEVLTSGSDAALSLGKCALSKLLTTGIGAAEIKQAIMTCAEQANLSMEAASLEEAVAKFAGMDCQETLDACTARGPRSVGARVTSTVASFFDSDVSEGMQRTFCSLRLQLCARKARGLGGGPDSGHPFADLLHLALFTPRKPGSSVVRMKDLEGLKLTLLINAATNDQAELWTASPSGAGVRRSSKPGRIGTWRRYGGDPGPALADAVAASACFPVFCRPLRIPWGEPADTDLLTDGGFHDNLGVLAIKDLVELESGTQTDLLLVADARRPPSEGPVSRADTISRAHDLLINQHSDATVENIKDWWKGRCRPVHVSLADSDPAEEKLAHIRTDLLPISDLDPQILYPAVQRFKRELNKNHCVSTWLRSRR